MFLNKNFPALSLFTQISPPGDTKCIFKAKLPFILHHLLYSPNSLQQRKRLSRPLNNFYTPTICYKRKISQPLK
jgi:hypothetical protein